MYISNICPWEVGKWFLWFVYSMKIINLRFSFDHKGIRFFTHFTFKNRYLCMSRLEFPPLSYLTSYIIFGIDVILNKIVETCQCHDQWNELFYRQNRAISHKRIFAFVIIRKKYLHLFQFGSLHVLKDNELHISWYRQCVENALRK